MNENVNEEKKLSDDLEEQTSTSDYDNIDADCKSYPQPLERPSIKSLSYSKLCEQPAVKARSLSTRSSSFRKKSKFGKVGIRKAATSRAASVAKDKRPVHHRASTLMHVAQVKDVPGSPNVKAKKEVETVDELKTVLDGLTEQFSRMEQRFDKQLGAFHKRFETMQTMQLTILAGIGKLARGGDSKGKTTQQNTTGTEI